MSILAGNRKAVISGMLGNGLEWYDYALYGHMSIVFSKIFFPANQESALLITLLVFALGFVARPAGAIFFGRLGDKFGRKRALTVSMMMMAVPTAGIGLLPTYADIGVAATALLILLRVIQGFSLGGAYSGSISYVVEHAPGDQRATVGSVIKLSLVIGFLAGSLVSSLVASLVSEEQFYAWGWRLPFLFGIGIGAIGYYIRHHGDESPVYEQAKKSGTLSQSPVRDAFFKHTVAMLRGFASYMCVTIPFYMVAIYMIAYCQKHLGLSETDALYINSIGMIAMLVLIYPAARAADRFGRKPVLLASIAVMVLTLYPVSLLLGSGSFMGALIAECLMALVVGWYLAPMPAVLVEMFPTSVRYTGMSLAYNFCAIVGGFTPYVSEWLIRETGNPFAMLWLMVFAAVLSVLSFWGYRDNWREPLN